MARDEFAGCAGGRVTREALLTLERRDQSADVLVVTSGWPNEDNPTYCVFIKRQMESLIDCGLRCDVLFIRGYRSALAYPFAALRLLSWSLLRTRRRYKLVHAHSGEAALAAAFYRRAPLLVSYLGDDLLGTPRADGGITPAGRIRRAVLRQSSLLAARTITKSREMQTLLPASVRARNIVLPNGVDTSLFRPMDRDAVRRQLGWDAEKRVALFAADPTIVRKRYRLAHAAVERAREELPDLQLYVAQGITPDHMPLLMNAADCLLLTSSIEGSPNVVKEALMCNLPIVATPAGDVRELLDGVSHSYVCEPFEEALSEGLVTCLLHPSRSNGRKALARLDARVIADSLLTLYRELAPGLILQPGTDGRRAVVAAEAEQA